MGHNIKISSAIFYFSGQNHILVEWFDQISEEAGTSARDIHKYVCGFVVVSCFYRLVLLS